MSNGCDHVIKVLHIGKSQMKSCKVVRRPVVIFIALNSFGSLIGHPQYASHVAQQLDAYTSVGSSDPSLPMVGRNVCQFLMVSDTYRKCAKLVNKMIERLSNYCSHPFIFF